MTLTKRLKTSHHNDDNKYCNNNNLLSLIQEVLEDLINQIEDNYNQSLIEDDNFDSSLSSSDYNEDSNYVFKNLCVVCGVNMGDMNGRQLCGKWRCTGLCLKCDNFDCDGYCQI